MSAPFLKEHVPSEVNPHGRKTAHYRGEVIRADERFAPGSLLLGLFIAGIFAAFWLFPRHYILAQMSSPQHPSPISLAYLTLAIRSQPRDTTLRFLLARQALDSGRLMLARSALLPWERRSWRQLPLAVAKLRLRLLLKEMRRLTRGTQPYTSITDEYVRGIDILLPRLSCRRLSEESNLLAGIGQFMLAVHLDRRILARTNDARLQKKAYLQGIRTLLGAGEPVLALKFARRELSRITPDLALWRLLTRLALMANKPALAARYARYMVGLDASEHA